MADTSLQIPRTESTDADGIYEIEAFKNRREQAV